MKKTTMMLIATAAMTLAAALPAFAAEEWIHQNVALSIHKVSTDQTAVLQISAAFYDAVADGDIMDDLIYFPAATIFGIWAIAPYTPWVLREGRLFFQVNIGAASVPVIVRDGLNYVPALETLGYLGTRVTQTNRDSLWVSVW